MIDPNAADLQHVHHVAHVELILLQLLAIQDVADDRQHLGFGLAAVVVDDPPQGLRRQESRGEPQAALLAGRERASLQKEQQPRDFSLHPGKQLLVVVRQRRDTPHPVASLRRLDQHGIALVVGAQHELPEELHLPAVAPLCLGLVAAGRREVLDPFGVFAAVEQHLIHADQQLACPVVVELRTEVLVGVEGDIPAEDQFQQIQKGGLACIALAGDQQQNGQPLQGPQVEQLQIVIPHLDLLAEDVRQKAADVREIPFGRLEGDRFVTIQKAVDLPPVVRVVGNRAESVVLRNAGQVILPEILAQGLDIPRQEDLDAPAAAQRLLNPLVDGCSHAKIGRAGLLPFSGHDGLLSGFVAHPPHDNDAARHTPQEQDSRSLPSAKA